MTPECLARSRTAEGPTRRIWCSGTFGSGNKQELLKLAQQLYFALALSEKIILLSLDQLTHSRLLQFHPIQKATRSYKLNLIHF